MKFEPVRDGLFGVGLAVALAGIAHWSIPMMLVCLGGSLMVLSVVIAVFTPEEKQDDNDSG